MLIGVGSLNEVSRCVFFIIFGYDFDGLVRSSHDYLLRADSIPVLFRF